MDRAWPADAETIRGATAARADHAGGHLVGRERELEEFERGLDDPDGPGLVLVHGERGAGRSAFARTAGEALRARDHTVLPLACVPGDQDRPLLLALRVVTAVREHRPVTGKQRPAGRADLDAEVLPAARRGARAALTEALLSALAHAAPVAVVVDDAQYADPASLDVLGVVAARRLPDVRLVLTSVRHGAGDPASCRHQEGAAGRFAQAGTVRTITLPRLSGRHLADMVARRSQAVPDPALVERVLALTRGVPAAADALLTEWSRQDAVRIADGHVFLAAHAPVPVLPDDDRFIRALHALGEPCRTVAAALSVLWPLGRTAAALAAECTGLSGREVGDGLRRLIAAGLLDPLPGEDGGGPRGWAFRSPLVEHSVRERLGPLERGRTSAAAVEALWAARDGVTAPERQAVIVDEADAETYLPDRIADAGLLVDRERAAAELTAAAESLHPDLGGRGMLRWFRTALRLVEDPAAHEQALLRCVKAAWVVGDHLVAGRAAETILRDPSDVLTGPELQEVASLLVLAVAAGKDWPRLSQMCSAHWWQQLPLPPEAALPARGLALCVAERWQEALDLLERTKTAWRTDPHARLMPELALAVGHMVQGRPGPLARVLDAPPAPGVPPDARYSVTTGYCTALLGAADLCGVMDLLKARRMAPEELPPGNLFLLLHLQGRWDDALALARCMVARDQVFTTPPQHHLVAAQTVAILAARGRTVGAARLIAGARGTGNGPLEIFLDIAEATVLRSMGRPAAAEQSLRQGLRAADARDYVYGTDELAAALAMVLVETGRADAAAGCLWRLKDLAGRTGNARTRLLYLLASARVLGRDAAGVRETLHEAVDLARSRCQPFETAVTLAAAAGAAGPPELLHEAYELFGETGSMLRRFHTRAAMREAGLTVPGRRQATAENEQLLATLITEGLTNRQIATMLRLSEDAVANRLSRLFARTGLRSRTEVVSAVLTGNPLTAADR
ncbi:AAA family ATPase [Streptomyces tubercidicus]|uniref:AAA family ATPase n=1 Tax=Streptomyces tubercidicus TaxID=47759 RepID=UPI003685B524